MPSPKAAHKDATALTRAAETLFRRKTFEEKPEGTTEAGTWRPSEKERRPCCDGVPAKGQALEQHCRTARHVAQLCGVAEVELVQLYGSGGYKQREKQWKEGRKGQTRRKRSGIPVGPAASARSTKGARQPAVGEHPASYVEKAEQQVNHVIEELHHHILEVARQVQARLKRLESAYRASRSDNGKAAPAAQDVLTAMSDLAHLLKEEEKLRTLHPKLKEK